MIEADTFQRQRILDFIIEYTAYHGYPPSMREIGAAVGLSSSATIHVHLRKLQRDGKITQVPGRARTIRVTR